MTMAVAPATPTTQPTAKARLLAPAFLESSIKMMAMIGMGLIATPMAKVMLSPIAWPMAPPGYVACGDTASTAARTVG